MFLPFVRAHFGDNESCRLPKTLLLIYCRWTKIDTAILGKVKFCHFRQKGLEQPKYMMETVDKQFRASVKVKWLLILALPVNIHHLSLCLLIYLTCWRWGKICLGALCWRRTRSMPSRSFKFNSYSNILYWLYDIFVKTFSKLTYHFLNRELPWWPSSASISLSRVLFGRRRRTLITWKSQMVPRSQSFIIFFSIPNKFPKNWILHS